MGGCGGVGGGGSGGRAGPSCAKSASALAVYLKELFICNLTWTRCFTRVGGSSIVVVVRAPACARLICCFSAEPRRAARALLSHREPAPWQQRAGGRPAALAARGLCGRWFLPAWPSIHVSVRDGANFLLSWDVWMCQRGWDSCSRYRPAS